ncbi:Protein ABSCISIC ACID-INSENSITIVE 5 [Melia azedarach]|uniref:Protein ABSCISIC ACID-INSENSITIVE 5 n=1 Tax=Melia azedarach TaxID=155640 RepID=A0ACC1YLW3_MELAZ|nr:Protein ABSCISIC ACID-INSENSITIVE 5 [Melia azedarach]
MAFSDSASVGYRGGESESLHQTPQSPKDQASSPLDRQNPIFSLTLDEIQLKSGKSFGSMNMDEFLTNLWNVDENQVSSQSSPNQNELQPTNDNNIIQTNPPTLTRQNSFSIPIQICKKTVDEVWFEIQKDVPMDSIISNHEPPERQQTFGEITLEEFLIKAGVVQEPTITPKPLSHQQKVDQQPIQINNINNSTYLDANFRYRASSYDNISSSKCGKQFVG